MKYDFDRHIERRDTDCFNYDGHPTDAADVMPLQAADMDFQTLPEVTAALRSVIDHGIYGYPIDPAGCSEAVQNWFSTRHNWTPDAEWRVSCRNVMSGTASLLQLKTNPGDAVMTFTPIYSPFLSAILQNDRRLVECPLVLRDGKWQINFEDFEQKIVQENVKMLLLCSPHNPVGRVWTRDELAHIARFCAENGVFVVSDEIHCDFIFPGHHHIPFLSLPETDLRLAASCTSASKTFNLALLENANIFIPDKECREKFHARFSAGFIEGGSYIGKLAATVAYQQGADWLDQLIEYLHGNMTEAVDFLRRELPELPVVQPEGTYLLWIDCRALGQDPDQLADWILEHAHLRLINGTAYGTAGRGFVRFNCARPRTELIEALRRLRSAVRS